MYSPSTAKIMKIGSRISLTMFSPIDWRRSARRSERVSRANRGRKCSWRAIALSGLMPIRMSLSSVTKPWVLLCWRRPAFFEIRTNGPRINRIVPPIAIPSSASRQDTRNASVRLTTVSSSEATYIWASM